MGAAGRCIRATPCQESLGNRGFAIARPQSEPKTPATSGAWLRNRARLEVGIMISWRFPWRFPWRLAMMAANLGRTVVPSACALVCLGVLGSVEFGSNGATRIVNRVAPALAANAEVVAAPRAIAVNTAPAGKPEAVIVSALTSTPSSRKPRRLSPKRPPRPQSRIRRRRRNPKHRPCRQQRVSLSRASKPPSPMRHRSRLPKRRPCRWRRLNPNRASNRRTSIRRRSCLPKRRRRQLPARQALCARRV